MACENIEIDVLAHLALEVHLEDGVPCLLVWQLQVYLAVESWQYQNNKKELGEGVKVFFVLFFAFVRDIYQGGLKRGRAPPVY